MNRKTSNGSLTTRSRIEKTRKKNQQQYGLARKNGSRHLDRLYTRECLLAQSRHASECSPASDVNIIEPAPQQPCLPTTNLKAYGDKATTTTVTLVIEPESSNPPQEHQISASSATPEPPSRTQSPQRKRTSKRYSSRWSSGVQLETLLESQEILLASPEAHNQHQQHEITNDKDGDGDGDWETVIGGSQQFCHPSSSSGNILLLAHSDAGSSIADYTSFASFSASERFMSPPGNRRKRRRSANSSSSPWHDSPMDFLRDSPRASGQHGPNNIHPSNALSDGGYPKLPPSPGRKRAVVPVLSSTFTYHHPTPLQRSHSNPFKVTPPYLDWRRDDDDDDDDLVQIMDQSSVLDQEDLDLPSGTVIHHSPQIYTPGASIADISTGIPSTWPSEADFNAISPTTAATPASTTAFQPSTPCPYERVYEGRYPPFRHGIGLKGVGGYFPPTNRLIDEDSSPVVKRISRADSPTSWHGSICNVSVSDADADLTESFEGAFPDSVDLLWKKDKGNSVDEGRRRKARSYYSIGMTPRSLKADIAQGLRRLSGISTERHSRKSFVLLPNGDNAAGDDKIIGGPQKEPIIPKRCFIRKVTTARPYSEYPSGSRRTSQLPRDFIPVRDSSRAHTKQNSVLSFRTSKRENELLRKRLTQIDLEGFTDIELDDRKHAVTAAQQSRSSQLRAKERVQGWLSTDMGANRQSQFQHHHHHQQQQPPPPPPPPTMNAIDKTLQQLEEAEEATHEWYRSQHGKYAFPQPPRLIAQHELHAIRRKSLHPYPRPPSSIPHDNYLEIEYIVKQRRLGKQILLCCSLCAPIGWLVVAYIGFEGSKSDAVMQWRSHGVVAGFHEKERRMARGLAVVQAVVVL
ncbi:hypothetical protein KEM56_000848, partial [Ascosphaera pollenicola]